MSKTRKTLRQIRLDSDMTIRQVLDRMQEFDPSMPRTHVGLIHIEQRGTDRLPILRALAHAYELPLDSIIAAASKSPEEICTI